jgi:hypothetical protein
MKRGFHLLQFILVAVILNVGNSADAQSGQGLTHDDPLFKEIAHLDSMVFNALNSRDVETFKSLFSPNLEFFHDRSGLTNYDHTIEFLKTTARNNDGLRRDLVPGSMEVYPVPGYGAMQIGAHTFCHIENGKKECGTFKFVHVWQKNNGEWKITRVISYGH